MYVKVNIPLSLVELDDKSYHIFTEAFINGNPVNLVIDTGASRTVMSRALAGDGISIMDGIENEPIQSAGIIAGKINTQMAVVRTFRVGNLEIPDFKVILIDLDEINHFYLSIAGKKIHGLLGGDFLLKYRALIDYNKMLMSLKTVKNK